MKNKTLRYTALALSTSIVITGCTPTNHVRGNIVQDFQLAEVAPGVDTERDILKKLGSPTTKATFDESTWYYIGQKTEKRGILDEEVLEERVIILSFNEEGTLEDVRDADNKRIDLPYSRRKTPTSGNEITVLQQLLGNLGRFNTEEQ
jgi:outer membrane protein assembly factor BamE (lipoprotein component of BamABCDE complex)